MYIEDHMDLAAQGRLRIYRRKRILAGDMMCPTCKGTGSVIAHSTRRPPGITAYERECFDCEGSGWLTRDQQHQYYLEAGYGDAMHVE